MFPPPKYDVSEFSNMKTILKPLFSIYKNNKSADESWLNLYRKVKHLEEVYDVELNPEHDDIGFCLFLFRQILIMIKHQAGLFSEEIDVSEWDSVIKLWGPVVERLFFNKNLRLKW